MVPKRRLRVALVSTDFGKYCVRLASALVQHAEVLLVLPQHGVDPHIGHLHNDVRLYSFQRLRIRQAIQQFRCIRSILRTIREFDPDVIHFAGAHIWFKLSLTLLRKYPLVLEIHDFQPHPGDQPLQQTPFWIEKFARRLADELIVHSRHVRDLAVRQLDGVAERISVIPHYLHVDGEPQAPDGDDAERSVLFFGRIWEYKGLEYLIRAEPLISARVPDVRFVFAGRGEDFSHYTRMMIHPDRFIVYNEYISEERAIELFRCASVVVLPYVEASQSGVIPMAYSAGKPVVATTVGGLPEMVEYGRTGFLVPPRDVSQLAEAIVRLLLDASLRRQMGANGKRKLEAECSPSQVAQQAIEVYRRAIERSARTPKAEDARAARAEVPNKSPIDAEEHSYSGK